MTDLGVWIGWRNEKFAPLSGIETLTIFADHDASGRGQQAARKCLARWVDAGCEVFIHTPHDVGSDWADLSMTKKPEPELPFSRTRQD